VYVSKHCDLTEQRILPDLDIRCVCVCVCDQSHTLPAFILRKKFLEREGSVFHTDWLEGMCNRRKFVTRVTIAQNRNSIKFCSSGPRMLEPSSLRPCLHAGVYLPSHLHLVMIKPFLPVINNILLKDVTG